MFATINVPDSLPQERLLQRIREIEESLIKEAVFIEKIRKAEGGMSAVKALSSDKASDEDLPKQGKWAQVDEKMALSKILPV